MEGRLDADVAPLPRSGVGFQPTARSLRRLPQSFCCGFVPWSAPWQPPLH
jgi:hypothetical protein